MIVNSFLLSAIIAMGVLRFFTLHSCERSRAESARLLLLTFDIRITTLHDVVLNDVCCNTVCNLDRNTVGVLHQFLRLLRQGVKALALCV